MVKKIIISLLVVVFVFGCISYRENKKISLKDIPLDFKGKDTIYYKRNTKIRVSKTDKYFIIQHSYKKSNAFIYKDVYTIKNKIYVGNGIKFYKIPVGKWYDYNDDGSFNEVTNYDEPYKFSVNQLIKKMKKEYHINLAVDDKDRDIDIRRYVDSIPMYRIYYLGADRMNYRRILVNGTTGKTMIFQKFTIDSARYGRPPQPDKLYFDSINRIKHNNVKN